jgi:hypothetical protein
MVRRRRIVMVALLAIGCSHGAGALPPAAPPPPQPAPGPPDAGAQIMNREESRPPSVPAWGPVIGGGTAREKDALAAVGAGQAQPADLAAPLTIGPALWALLVKLDPALGEAGTKSTIGLPHRTGQQQTLDVRSFTHEPERAALLRSPGFRKIGRAFAQANVRAATDAEREMFYLLVPFEITGRAVTIAERDADRLVVFLDDKGRLAWLDVLSAYR